MVLVAMDSSGLLVPLLLLEAAALWWGWPSGAGHGWQRPPCAAAAAAPGGGLVVVLVMDNMQNICETQAEFFRALKMAFTSKGSEAPEVIEIAAPDVHDYDAAYLERVNPKLSHHTKPHQFRIMKFGEQVLVHYRMWSTHKLWLPGEHTVQHDAPSAAFPEKKLPEKARSSRQKKKRSAASSKGGAQRQAPSSSQI